LFAPIIHDHDKQKETHEQTQKVIQSKRARNNSSDRTAGNFRNQRLGDLQHNKRRMAK